VTMCAACLDLTPCKGGGNRDCRKRDKRESILAGILDTYGGLRFVVTYRAHLKFHRRPDEVAVIVPDLTVHEPIAWGDISGVTRRIELAVDDWLARGPPNEAYAQECATMYKLRRSRGFCRGSVHIHDLVET
jgi:hypothetical protein